MKSHFISSFPIDKATSDEVKQLIPFLEKESSFPPHLLRIKIDIQKGVILECSIKKTNTPTTTKQKTNSPSKPLNP